MFERGNIPHQNRLCFSLLLSFAEAKESRETNLGKRKEEVLAQAKKGNSIASDGRREYCIIYALGQRLSRNAINHVT
jgi:hypothetical protein